MHYANGIKRVKLTPVDRISGKGELFGNRPDEKFAAGHVVLPNFFLNLGGQQCDLKSDIFEPQKS